MAPTFRGGGGRRTAERLVALGLSTGRQRDVAIFHAATHSKLTHPWGSFLFCVAASQRKRRRQRRRHNVWFLFFSFPLHKGQHAPNVVHRDGTDLDGSTRFAAPPSPEVVFPNAYAYDNSSYTKCIYPLSLFLSIRPRRWSPPRGSPQRWSSAAGGLGHRRRWPLARPRA